MGYQKCAECKYIFSDRVDFICPKCGGICFPTKNVEHIVCYNCNNHFLIDNGDYCCPKCGAIGFLDKESMSEDIDLYFPTIYDKNGNEIAQIKNGKIVSGYNSYDYSYPKVEIGWKDISYRGDKIGHIEDNKIFDDFDNYVGYCDSDEIEALEMTAYALLIIREELGLDPLESTIFREKKEYAVRIFFNDIVVCTAFLGAVYYDDRKIGEIGDDCSSVYDDNGSLVGIIDCGKVYNSDRIEIATYDGTDVYDFDGKIIGSFDYTREYKDKIAAIAALSLFRQDIDLPEINNHNDYQEPENEHYSSERTYTYNDYGYGYYRRKNYSETDNHRQTAKTTKQDTVNTFTSYKRSWMREELLPDQYENMTFIELFNELKNNPPEDEWDLDCLCRNLLKRINQYDIGSNYTLLESIKKPEYRSRIFSMMESKHPEWFNSANETIRSKDSYSQTRDTSFNAQSNGNTQENESICSSESSDKKAKVTSNSTPFTNPNLVNKKSPKDKWKRFFGIK